MPPGRKDPASKGKAAEAPLTEYDKERAQNIMRNNQMLQRLGVTTMISMLNTTSKSKDIGREDSGSWYDDQGSDDSDEEVAKNVPRKRSKRTVHTSSIGTRASKRVVAPGQINEPTRVTGQRTEGLLPTSSSDLQQVITATATHHELVSGGSQTERHDQENISDEGALITTKDPDRIRGRSMGKDLERINRDLSTKVAIQIANGKRRPEAPMQAAKLASEVGIILRQQIPIRTHWKKYKNDEAQIEDYIGKIGAKFYMDTNDTAVRHACADLLRGGQRQMRYRLKAKYFNGVPANKVRTTSPVPHMAHAEWKELVDMWSDSEHKKKCITNQTNRGKVQFQQRTGSRCYIAQAHVVKQEKCKDVEPTAIDLFKDFHCSRITGFTEPVKKVIAAMEEIVNEPIEEGQLPKSAIEAVAQVVPKSKFLKNVGMVSSSMKSHSLQVKELQAELQTERQEKSELRQQIKALKNESEKERSKQADEIESLKKSSMENNSLLRQLLQFSQGQASPIA